MFFINVQCFCGCVHFYLCVRVLFVRAVFMCAVSVGVCGFCVCVRFLCVRVCVLFVIVCVCAFGFVGVCGFVDVRNRVGVAHFCLSYAWVYSSVRSWVGARLCGCVRMFFVMCTVLWVRGVCGACV